jgi:hypothetical protein
LETRAGGPGWEARVIGLVCESSVGGPGWRTSLGGLGEKTRM